MSTAHDKDLSEHFRHSLTLNDGMEEQLIEENAKYEVRHSEVFGRYLAAKKELKAGKVLIREGPLVIGPCVTAETVCLGCYRPVTLKSTQYRCRECRWPLCSDECPGYYQTLGHTKEECDLLKSSQLTPAVRGGSSPSSGLNADLASLEFIKNLYELIVILRILLMRVHRAESYERILLMEDHLEERRLNHKLWHHYETNVVQVLKEKCPSAFIEHYSDDDIQRICGILDVNCFEIGQTPVKARALYPSAFLLAHNCRPNTTHTDHPQTYELILCTSRRVRRQEALTLSYAYTLQGTLKRREFMQAGKLFWCCCERCSDPYELGSDCSALRCENCNSGLVRSSNPLEQEADWSCDQCSTRSDAGKIVKLLDKVNDDLERIDVHNVDGLESFLQRNSTLLGPNHYLLLSAKYSLCQIYGRIEGYLLPDLSLDALKRKETYCREFLKVIEILEPGLTRLRGLIMYELHAPIMVISQYHTMSGLVKRAELKRRIEEVVALLRESSRILQMEPKGSKEFEMGLAAREALLKMEQS